MKLDFFIKYGVVSVANDITGIVNPIFEKIHTGLNRKENALATISDDFVKDDLEIYAIGVVTDGPFGREHVITLRKTLETTAGKGTYADLPEPMQRDIDAAIEARIGVILADAVAKARDVETRINTLVQNYQKPANKDALYAEYFKAKTEPTHVMVFPQEISALGLSLTQNIRDFVVEQAQGIDQESDRYRCGEN